MQYWRNGSSHFSSSFRTKIIVIYGLVVMKLRICEIKFKTHFIYDILHVFHFQEKSSEFYWILKKYQTLHFSSNA